jgi:peptidoglycan DL-endopeptidase CwlO
MEVNYIMGTKAIIKTSLCLSATLLALSSPKAVDAATVGPDTGIAGITPLMENYYSSPENQDAGTAEEYLISVLQELDKENGTNLTQVVAPYANLGISTANNYVNIREEANTDSEVVGKLYNGCATDILETVDDWVKIKSGNVEGYIKSEYLAIGSDAEELVEEVSDKYAVVKTETLFVREEQNTDSDIVTMIPMDEKYYIENEYEEWVEISFDEEGKGFVSKEYIDIEVEFEYAISIEEEQARIAAEEAAKQAEIERLEQLAREQEEREAAERAAAEAKKATKKKKSTKASTSTSAPKQTEAAKKKSSKKTEAPKSNSGNSSKGQDIANYALKFVGNPYKWGGESLTNGADCSGFTKAIYSHFGYSIPRTSGSQSSGAGREVSVGDRQPGDLISYTKNGRVNHVAIYIGNNKVVHASNERDGIKVSTYNYRSPHKVRRIL